jgi:Zn ribbon nucleic-acid-binding protein
MTEKSCIVTLNSEKEKYKILNNPDDREILYCNSKQWTGKIQDSMRGYELITHFAWRIISCHVCCIFINFKKINSTGSEWSYCLQTNHPYYRCPTKPTSIKTCFSCNKQGHIAKYCKYDISCKHCGKSGHIKRDCPAHKEETVRKEYGDYFHEILEGSIVNKESVKLRDNLYLYSGRENKHVWPSDSTLWIYTGNAWYYRSSRVTDSLFTILLSRISWK